MKAHPWGHPTLPYPTLSPPSPTLRAGAALLGVANPPASAVALRFPGWDPCCRERVMVSGLPGNTCRGLHGRNKVGQYEFFFSSNLPDACGVSDS